MKIEMLLLIKKHANTLIDQRETRLEETFEFKMNEQMEAFSFSPPINLVEEGKCLLGVNSFEAANSVFTINDENNSFSNTIPGHWSSRGGAEKINRLQRLLKIRSENDIKLHVEEVRERGNLIKLGEKEQKLSDLDSRENEIFQELKILDYIDLEDMAFRKELTNHEVAEILDMEYIDASTTGYTFHQEVLKLVKLF